MSYDVLKDLSYGLHGEYADVMSADEMLGTGHAGTGVNARYKCTPPIIRISSLKSLAADEQRPQVLLSGEIHGNERVGPQSVYETGHILVSAANCLLSKNQIDRDGYCQILYKYGITSYNEVRWLALLATRRETFIIPTTNCLGYRLNRREDNGIDPNRDFGYVRLDDNCLSSTTAKILNALFYHTIIQIVLTFHGGMEAIGYEWGSHNHRKPKDQSPDHHASSQIGACLSAVGGGGFKASNKVVPPYSYGPMNSFVYPVYGGMEDWTYAAGWDTANTKMCKKNLNTPTIPDNRAMVFLVETSNAKKPDNKDLGGSAFVLDNKSPENGHVPRNIRLSLMAVDVVEPYVCMLSTNRTRIIVKNGNNVKKPAATTTIKDNNNTTATDTTGLSISWSVGGAFQVSSTWLAWHPVAMSEEELSSLDGDYTKYIRSLKAESGVRATTATKGPALWSLPTGDNSNTHQKQFGIPEDPFGASFTALVSASRLPTQPSVMKKRSLEENRLTNQKGALKPGRYWLVAWAEVDQSWGEPNQGMPERENPQSHLSNLRTNTSYTKHVSSTQNVQIKPSVLRGGGGGEGRPDKLTSSLEKSIKGGHLDLFSRTVQGRKAWPSDAMVVDVDANGDMHIRHATYHCSWWNRVHYDKNGVVDDFHGTKVPFNTIPSSYHPVKEKNHHDLIMLSIGLLVLLVIAILMRKFCDVLGKLNEGMQTGLSFSSRASRRVRDSIMSPIPESEAEYGLSDADDDGMEMKPLAQVEI